MEASQTAIILEVFLINDLDNTIAELREEFERIRAALAALEQLAAGGKRRGRPPKWLAKVRRSAAAPARPAVKKRAGKPSVNSLVAADV
jgi:hypothetical protein